MSRERITLTLAHSPDPDDVFMWWPLTGKVDASSPETTIEPPVLDTGRFTFRSLPADIDVLNRRAIERGDLDITALSMFAWAAVADRYILTSCGSSMGEGYGPKVVVKDAFRGDVVNLRGDEGRGPVVAVPGVRTTAFLLLSMVLGRGRFAYREMPFDRILHAVSSDQVQAGLLIHQSQLTFGELGLRPLIDLGAWWSASTGLPLPLGGNALRRDLDARYGEGTLTEVASLLDQSVRYALAHRDESTRYAMSFAPEISRSQADEYIDMYVSDLTVDAGDRGMKAVQRLLDEAKSLQMVRQGLEVEMIRPRNRPV